MFSFYIYTFYFKFFFICTAFVLFGLLFAATTINGYPKPDEVEQQSKPAAIKRGTEDKLDSKNIVGVASHIVTNSLLRHQMDSRTNFVFSPLGFSSILAILREGAQGETKEELERVLDFPSDIEMVRNSYAAALNHLAVANPSEEPQFKTWFYVYRGNSVNPTFKDLVEKNYGVEVKEINRFDFDDLEKSEPEYTYPTTTGFAGLEFSDEQEELVDTGEKTKAKEDVESLDSLKKEIIKAEEEINKAEEEEIYKKKEASKFDRVVDDKQYVEVPVAKEEVITTEVPKEPEIFTETPTFMERLETGVPDFVESGTTEAVTEMSSEISNEINQEEPEIVSTPHELDPNSEIMQAVESHIVRKRTKSAIIEDDVASALSGNSIVGKKSDDSEEYESKMLLFNGLYFRGNWAVPFQQLRDEASDVFYNSTSEKSRVTMMRSRGKFRTGFIESIDSHAVEIPYENKRYTLMIVMPKPHDGIRNLIKRFDLTTLGEINAQLKEEQIHLVLPRFKVETTNRAEKAIAKVRKIYNTILFYTITYFIVLQSGVLKLFSKEADLSGITTDQALHVDELVQHVSVRVDEGAVSQNAFSATNLIRSGSVHEELLIDHPFLFFVRDIIDDIVVVAGKICHVTPSKPVTFFKKISAKN